MNKTPFVYLLPVLLIFILSPSCKDGESPDLSGIKTTVGFHPFYKDFSQLNPQDLANELGALKAKYPSFLDFYLDTLVGLNVHHQYDDPNTALQSFLTYKDYRGLLDTVNSAFPDTKEIDRKVTAVFRHIKYYDSSFYIPQHVFYFVSGLNKFTAVIQNENNFGIGLDMFLGAGFDPYFAIGIPDYALIRLTAENIPVWVGKAVYQDKYPFFTENKNLLEMMIEKGKELYFLEKILPEMPAHITLGYSTSQLDWVKENEMSIYNFFLQHKLLFEKDQQKIMRYVMDGPTTPGFPEESPGNLGSFIGWKIVQQYAKKNNKNFTEVLKEADAQRILKQSNYKP